jgi:siroheme synthase
MTVGILQANAALAPGVSVLTASAASRAAGQTHRGDGQQICFVNGHLSHSFPTSIDQTIFEISI